MRGREGERRRARQESGLVFVHRKRFKMDESLNFGDLSIENVLKWAEGAGQVDGAETGHKKKARRWGRAFGGMYWLVYLGDILDYL